MMKNFVKGLFNAKKLAEDVGFLDPAKFAPDIKQQVEQLGLGKQMYKAQQLGSGFSGYTPKGSFSQENVMMGVGLKEDVREVSKFFMGQKKDLSEPLKQLRSIAFSVPGVQDYLTDESGRRIEEKIEEFLPGEQFKQQVMGLVKSMPVKSSKKKRSKRSSSGKGFSAENVMMGVGIPKQDEFSGHILAGAVPKKNSAYGTEMSGGLIGTIASIIAGVAVPELISFVKKKIQQKKKKSKKKKN